MTGHSSAIREPRRQSGRRGVPLREVLGYLRANRTSYLCHNVGIAFLMFSSYGAAAWVPTYFIRTFGWSPGRVGLVYGALAATCGLIGVLGGGWLADRLTRRGHRDGPMLSALWTTLLWFPTGIAYLLAPTPLLAFVLLAPTIALAASAYSIGPAALMQITPGPMRSQAGAVSCSSATSSVLECCLRPLHS